MVGISMYMVIIITFVILILASAIRILREYERGVVFRLGRLMGSRGPGLILLIPVVDRMVRVSLRTVVMDVPGDHFLSRSGFSLQEDG